VLDELSAGIGPSPPHRKETISLRDLSSLLRPPYLFLILGVIAVSASVIFTFTGKVWVRFNGWVYRIEKPKAFWGEVAAYFFIGVFFIGLSLSIIAGVFK